MRKSNGIVFPIKGLSAIGQLQELFFCTEKTAVNFVGSGRLRTIRYDRQLDILTFVGEDVEKEDDR